MKTILLLIKPGANQGGRIMGEVTGLMVRTGPRKTNKKIRRRRAAASPRDHSCAKKLSISSSVLKKFGLTRMRPSRRATIIPFSSSFSWSSLFA